LGFVPMFADSTAAVSQAPAVRGAAARAIDAPAAMSSIGDQILLRTLPAILLLSLLLIALIE